MGKNTMSSKPATALGYIKYEGKLVELGIIDARSAARALNGFDSAVRFFVNFDRPDLAAADIPLPIQIQKGSWIAEIPQHAGTLILTGLGVVGVKYLSKAAEKMAEKDFANIGLADALQRSLHRLQWFIRTAKHLGHSNIRAAKMLWGDESVEIINNQNKGLKIPKDLVKALASAPVTLLAEIADVVEVERTLTVGVRIGHRIEEESINREEKLIFSDSDEPDDIVLPDLVHGQTVILEGVVTRGNELTNTLGFWYQGRILTSRPRHGNIVRFKKHLFLTCRLRGEVTRLDKSGNPTEKKPRLLIESLRTLSSKEQLRFSFLAEDAED